MVTSHLNKTGCPENRKAPVGSRSTPQCRPLALIAPRLSLKKIKKNYIMVDFNKKIKGCMKIQWSKLHTVNGIPVCPECGQEAEMILGFFGNPCWGHKIKKEKKQKQKLGGKLER